MAGVGISSALRPYLAARHGRAADDAQLLTEELVHFLSHRGLAVDEEAGQQVITSPLEALTPELGWAFVADDLASRVSLPVVRLARMARMLGRALEDAAARGSFTRTQALAISDALREAAAELPRLDALARALGAEVAIGRPDHALWARDRGAYGAAMEAWEASRRVDQEIEGGFEVLEASGELLRLHHPSGPDPTLRLSQPTVALARKGDRIDALLGRAGDRFLVLDTFAVAAPRPPE